MSDNPLACPRWEKKGKGCVKAERMREAKRLKKLESQGVGQVDLEVSLAPGTSEVVSESAPEATIEADQVGQHERDLEEDPDGDEEEDEEETGTKGNCTQFLSRHRSAET